MPLHVALVGADLFSAYHELARGLKQVGARVTGIGPTPSAARLAPGLRPWLDGWEPTASLTDARALVDAVRRASRRWSVDRIETGDETLVMPTAEARAMLGLPGLSTRSALLCRDKPAMKDALRAAGLPCAESAAVGSLAEIEAFAERVGYPLAVKPRAGLGGIGARRVDNSAELRSAAVALNVGGGGSAAVEEWIEGHEGFYDTLTIGGNVVHEFVAHYYPPVLQALADRRLSPQIAATNRVEVSSYVELRQIGRKVIEALGIETAATHMEWFFGPKGLRFSEIGCRPPGVGAWDLYSAGNDIDVYREWAHAIVHGHVAARPSRRFASGIIALRPDKDGHIAGYTGVDEIQGRYGEWVLDAHLPDPGTPTQGPEAGYMANAYVRMRHPDYDVLRQMLDDVGRTVHVHAA
jgi:formate-dependent phosphoribosylglycinamide formyltransferase (GAR transformylase)